MTIIAEAIIDDNNKVPFFFGREKNTTSIKHDSPFFVWERKKYKFNEAWLYVLFWARKKYNINEARLSAISTWF